MKRLNEILKKSLVLLLIGQICTLALPVYAEDITVDTSVPVGSRPTIDTAQNGVTLINLAATSSKGVSHNKFENYNVGPNGLILNNSKDMGVSVLGGAVYGNPNYQGNGKEASIVINEVTGTNRTNLFGATEMFGRSAEFILVNPNGILCNGAGFINMPRVTLGTGTTVFDQDIFKGINVNGGSLIVEGKGIDAGKVNYFEIVTRVASLNGGIWGKDVKINTGTGFYNYSDRSFTQQVTGTALPEFGIDASALGSIYAGKIMLVSNESGVGVRSIGDMIADVSDITIRADGSIELRNVQAKNNISAASASGDIRQNGDAVAMGSIDFTAMNIVNRGTVKSNGNIILSGQIDNNNGIIGAGGDIDLFTGGILNNNGGRISTNQILTVTGSLDSVNNRNGFIGSSGALSFITTGGFNNINGTVCTSAGIAIAGGIDNSSGVIASGGNMALDVSGSTLVNQGGTIGSGGSLTLTGAIDNSGGTISSDGSLNMAGILNNSTGKLSSKTIISITGSIDNEDGEISSINAMELNAAGTLNNINGLIVLSGESGTLHIFGLDDLDNTDGNIKSGDTIQIDKSGDFTINAGTGNIYADKMFQLNAVNITNDGNIEMNGSIDINASGNFTTQAGSTLVSNKTVSIDSSGNITNSGLISGNNLDISSVNLTNSSGGLISGGEGNSEISAAGIITNSGKIGSRNNLTINSTGITNSSILSEIAAANVLAIDADTLLNDRGLIFAGNDMTITSRDLDNNRGYIYSTGTMQLLGKAASGNSINNFVGHIESERDLTINLGTDGVLENIGEDSGGYELGADYIYIGEKPESIYANNRIVPPTVPEGDYSGYNYYFIYHDYSDWNHLDGLVGDLIESSYQSICNFTGLKPDSWTQLYYRNIKSTMQTDKSYIVSGDNIVINTGLLLNKSSIISASNDNIINTKTLNNVTSSMDAYISNYKVFKKLDKAHLIYHEDPDGDGSEQSTYSLDYIEIDTSYQAATVKIYSADQALIQSGGTLTVNGGNSGIVNNSGIIQSQNDININNGAGGIVINDGTFQTPGDIHITTGAVENKKAYNPTGIQQPDDPEVIVYNTAVIDQIADTGTIDILNYINIGTEGNAIFTVNADNPGSTYLIETRSEFIDVSKLKGSQYFLDRIGFSPDNDLRFLGDAYYEQKIVMEAILKATQQRFLDESIQNDQDQMTWLLDNAASAYRDLHLAVGVKLTKDQINLLQQPIIWYVEEEVMGVKVLVPEIYIPEHIIAGFTKNTGSVIAGNSVKIEADGDVENSGVIKGNTSVDIAAGTIKNETIGSTATISGGDVSLNAYDSIINTGGTVKGDNSVSLTTETGDIINETLVKTEKDYRGNITSTLGTSASIESGGTLVINSGGDFTNIAANVSAGGNAEISADRNINFETVRLDEKSVDKYGSKKSVTETSTVVGSSLDVGGNLTLSSGQDINFIGSTADIAGKADVDADGNFNLINDYNTSYYESTKTNKGTFSSKTTNVVETSKTVVGSSFNTGGDLSIDSGNDINIVGSDINSGGNADMNAAGNENIIAVHDEHYYKKTTEKSGFGTGDSLYGTEKKTDMVSDKTVVGSALDIKGKYASDTGGDTNITGSSITAAEADITTGGDLNITAAYNEHAEEHKTETSGYGTGDGDVAAIEIDVQGSGYTTASASTLNFGSLTVNSGNNVHIEGSVINADNASFNTEGDFTETSAKETSYEYSFHEKTTVNVNMDALKEAYKSIDFEGGRASATLGSAEYENITTRTDNTTQSSSELNIGDSLTIDSGNDITVAGSNISAGGDVSLSAVNNVSIETTEEGTKTESEEIIGKAELTVGVKNAVADVALATKALLDAKDAVEKAKNDYDKYKDNLKKAKDDLSKGLIDEDDYESLMSDEKYYLANIAMASENVVAKTAALLQATAAAAASAGSYGFSADLQLQIDGTHTTSSSESITSHGSSINAGGNFTVTAGNRAKIEGSDVSSDSDIIIDAKTVDILAAENTSKSSSQTETISATVTLLSSAGGGPSISGSGSVTEKESKSTTYTNSHLNGSNITIRSAEDTTVKGGVVTAENALTLDIGGDLTVQSLQDKTKSDEHTIGVSGGSGGSAGANANMSNGNKKWVTEQTSLTGGTVDIDVANKTTLKGAVIDSTTGELTLDTGSLDFSDIKDKDRSNNLGGGVNAGSSKDGITGSVNATYGFTDIRQTNFATIGEGTITVRDGDKDLTGLNRDVSISQYNTKDGGLEGGFTVDTQTLKFVADTAGLVADTADHISKLADENNKEVTLANDLNKVQNAAGSLYWDACEKVENDINKAGVVVEKTGNAIEYGHYTTDGKVQYYLTMDGYENKVENGLAVNDNDKMIYYGAKAWVGEKLDTSEQNAANQSFGNVLHDDILDTYKSSDAKSVNNDIRLLSGLDSNLAGDVNSTFAGIREEERNQKIIQENKYLADFKELDRSKTDAYIAQQGSDNTLLSLGVKAYVALNSRDGGDSTAVNCMTLESDPNSPLTKAAVYLKDKTNELGNEYISNGNRNDNQFDTATGLLYKAISFAIPEGLGLGDVATASGTLIGKEANAVRGIENTIANKADDAVNVVDDVQKLHKNSNAYVGAQGVYEIRVDDEILKYGKADMTNISTSTDNPRRLQTQLDSLAKQNPDKDITGTVLYQNDNISTKQIKEVETKYIQNYYDTNGELPPKNQNHPGIK